jgi:hypothetical protein
VGKSVSFLKKINVKFKNSFQKVLEIKKILPTTQVVGLV